MKFLKSLQAEFWVPLLVAACLSACSTPERPPTSADFKAPEKAMQFQTASKAEMALFDEVESPVFMIGKGDIIKLDVMNRPEVSGKLVVGPDGRVTVPLLGTLKVDEHTREAAQDMIEKGLSRYYTYPVTTLTIEEYISEYVTVLGRVEKAGMQRFNRPATLAEVLASAGAMPILDKQATLSKCAIMRGRNKVIWVDLKPLLKGDPTYNLRLKKGDIVYIPDSSDTSVYVMGMVKTPGSYRLTPRMTVLDALNQAGGLAEDADENQISIYRANVDQVETFTLKELINPDRKFNFALEDGDILFVPKSGMGKFGYVMRTLAPGINALSIAMTAASIWRLGTP